LTIPNAALPTLFIVNAENTYGNIAPNSKPVNTTGWVRVTGDFELSSKWALCKKPPYKANATRAALPIAKPLPIAAVVLPAASKASVRYLVDSPKAAI
jgi:hypothetical protein